jgi:alpha-galactosidase
VPEIRVTLDERELVIATELLAVSVDLDHGTYDLDGTGSEPSALHGCAATVRTSDGEELTTRGAALEAMQRDDVTDYRGAGVRAVLSREGAADAPGLLLSITVYESQPYVLLRVELKNDTSKRLRIAAFEPLSGGRLELPAEPGSWRYYRHGWQSWSPTLVLPCSGEDDPVAPPLYAPGTSAAPEPGRFISEMVTAVVEPESQSGIVAGFVTVADQFSQVWLDRESAQLGAASYADGLAVELGGSLVSETLYVELTDEPLWALEHYGEVLAAEMKALQHDEVASGWCSWYRYFTEVSEEDVISNLEDLASRQDEIPVKYVQLDDGYQADIGDWLTLNEKFPHGLKWLVAQIHEGGYAAGLWLAPFLVGANSQLYKDHPDWVVRYASNTPYIAIYNWGQVCYALDLSRDDVIQWLGDVFRTVTEEWGFDYVKIDFIYAGAVDGIRANEGMTRAQLYRRGLQTIRDAAGERFILGCGNPMGPSIGLVNGSRIGPDVAPFWDPQPFTPIPQRNAMAEPSALNSIRNTITRYWMHGRLWQNDPDCLLVREAETSLTRDEVRTLTTVIAMTGGMVLDSDDLTALSDERREMISLLLPAYGKSAEPTDLFTSDMPTVLELDCGAHRMIALFNWGEESDAVSAAIPERSHVFDVWERRYLGASEASISLEAAAHGCRLLAVRPVLARPRVVGSTFHLLQGACEIEGESWADGTLHISTRPVAVNRGALYVCFPDGMSPQDVEGVDAKVAEAGDGIWTVAFELQQPLDLMIRTAR